MKPHAAPQSRPLYVQIKELLRQRLADGEWSPGELLPSEIALALEYGVSQGTLRKALDELASERLVVRKQGRGTFAAKHDAERSLFQFFHLHGKNGERQLPSSRVIRMQRGQASAAEAQALQIKAREPVLNLFRVRSLNGRPAILERITVPGALLIGLDTLPVSEIPNRLYGFYEKKYGLTVVRAVEKLRAVAANKDDEKWLGTAAGTPLLEIDRIALNIDQRPVEWRVSRCDTKQYHYLNDLI